MTQPPEPPPGSPPGWGPAPPQQPYGQQPYGQQPYGYPYGPVGRQTDGMAIAVLVLAVTSFVVCPLVPAIVALALAPGARRNIAESGGMKDGEGLITAGVIVAWIHLAFAAIGVILLVVLLAAFSSDGGSGYALFPAG